MVAHHTALQPKLPISLRWIPGEGDKIEALDPLQASHAVHLLLSADQAAMLLDPDGTVPTLCRKERNAFRKQLFL